MRYHHLLLIAAMGAGAACAAAQAQTDDPPMRVGRLSYLNGQVSLYFNGDTGWTDAALNYPLSSGDALWTDTGARAELEFGASTVRFGDQTSVSLGEISDTVTQFKVNQGSVDVNVVSLGPDEVYEIDTPTGVVALEDQGRYRIDVTPDGGRSVLTVRDGAAEVIDGDNRYPVSAGASATLASGVPPQLGAAIPTDAWETWADDRAGRTEAPAATQYVSPDMVGYQDLDQYGNWQNDPEYGEVWIPRDMPADWAPYRYGHWASIPPWGWTWIDDEPWGFAPFHYGRWAYRRGSWEWAPGVARARPAYAPALVAFVGGDQFGIQASFGNQGGVAWIPLAPGEPYVPAFHASSRYSQRVNVDVRGMQNGVTPRIDEVHLANRDAPRAVTAVPRDVFARSRPVRQAAVPVRTTNTTTVRPSAVPVAGTQPVAAPRQPQAREQGRGKAAPRPPASAVPTGRGAPAPPPPWWQSKPPRGQVRPNGREPQRAGRGGNTTPPNPPNQPPSTQAQPPRPSGPPRPRPTQVTPTPPPPPPAATTGRGRGRGSEPPRPSGPPRPRPTQVNPTPPPPPPPPPAASTGRGRGRGQAPRPSAPPQARPTPVPPKPLPPPPPPSAATTGRGRGEPVRPSAPPQARPTPVPPKSPPPPPSQGRGHGRQGGPPPAHPTKPPHDTSHGRGGRPTSPPHDTGHQGGTVSG